MWPKFRLSWNRVNLQPAYQLTPYAVVAKQLSETATPHPGYMMNRTLKSQQVLSVTSTPLPLQITAQGQAGILPHFGAPWPT